MRRRLLAVAVALLGLAALVGGCVAITMELTRSSTDAEQVKAGQKELATRWRRLTGDEIFPAFIEPEAFAQDSEAKAKDGALMRAHRVGVAIPVPCGDAFDPQLAAVLKKNGCGQVLRATYVDWSGTLAATLGIAVMPDAKAVHRAETAIVTELGVDSVRRRYGVHVVAFPGTPAADFTDAGRQDFFKATTGSSPYLFFRSSGWIVPRGRLDPDEIPEKFGFASTALTQVMNVFSDVDAPCKRKAVRC